MILALRDREVGNIENMEVERVEHSGLSFTKQNLIVTFKVK